MKSWVLLFLLGMTAWAGISKLNGYLVNETALAYSKTYPISLNSYAIDAISFQSIASSVTIPSLVINTATNGFAFKAGSSVIIGTNTFTTGLEVLFSTSAAVAKVGLVSGTTYFAGLSTGNSFSLATSQANAIAGTFITLTSSSSSGNYTFSSPAISGTPSYKWQVSNDGLTWSDYTQTIAGIAVPAVSLGTYNSTGTLTSWDFGYIQYAFVRLNVTGPTTGGINLKVSVNGKSL